MQVMTRPMPKPGQPQRSGGPTATTRLATDTEHAAVGGSCNNAGGHEGHAKSSHEDKKGKGKGNELRLNKRKWQPNDADSHHLNCPAAKLGTGNRVDGCGWMTVVQHLVGALDDGHRSWRRSKMQ